MKSTKQREVVPLDHLRSHPVEHLVVECCDVLYDDSEWKRWLLCLVTRMGLHTHYTPFFRVWDREFQGEVWTGERDFWSAIREFLLSSGLSKLQIEEVVAATRAKKRGFDSRVRPFAGVPATLKRLTNRGTELTVVSRTPLTHDQISSRLCQMGLSAFSSGVAASRVPFIEADPFFRWLVSLGKFMPSRAAYLGRNGDDLSAAAKSGMLAIAFNHDADAAADIYLDQFDQLDTVIRGSGALLAAG